jgi:phage regulator Rha-like protein
MKTQVLTRGGKIESRILTIREHRVMLDSDLAELYGVSTRRLNEQVKRNQHRFPADFMFQLTKSEARALRSQFATSKAGRGGRRYRPYAFTEHGAIMVASVLNTRRAVEVSVYVVRAFVRLREMLSTHKELARKLSELEKRIQGHDEEIVLLFEAIRKLMEPPGKPRKRIGFHS